MVIFSQTTKSVCIDIYKHIGLNSTMKKEINSFVFLWTNVVHTNQDIPLNLYGVKI